MWKKETKALINRISKADWIHTIALNVVFPTTGIMLSGNSVHYLSSICNELQNLDGIKEQNSTEIMIDYLKTKKFKHVALYHDGSHNQLMSAFQDK